MYWRCASSASSRARSTCARRRRSTSACRARNSSKTSNATSREAGVTACEHEFGDRLIYLGTRQPLAHGCSGFDAAPLARHSPE